MNIAPRIRLGGSRIRVSPKEDRTYAGRVYHSKAEMLKAAELDAMKNSGEIMGWYPQFPLPVSINGKLICKVIVDFKVFPYGGSPYFIEIKGHETEVWKLKRKMLLAFYPGIDLRVERA